MTGDALKLRQVMENLIRNAMESFEGTTVLQREIVVSITSTPTDVHIAVEDNGAGLSGDISTRVFDPFFTTKARGTGLGLSIANEIVRAHQGTLALKSKPNGGTVASLVLPRFGEQPREAIASELGGASE
jgi:C4-dicarboxylate-specific signal transduction histidine kinase